MCLNQYRKNFEEMFFTQSNMMSLWSQDFFGYLKCNICSQSLILFGYLGNSWASCVMLCRLGHVGAQWITLALRNLNDVCLVCYEITLHSMFRKVTLFTHFFIPVTSTSFYLKTVAYFYNVVFFTKYFCELSYRQSSEWYLVLFNCISGFVENI